MFAHCIHTHHEQGQGEGLQTADLSEHSVQRSWSGTGSLDLCTVHGIISRYDHLGPDLLLHWRCRHSLQVTALHSYNQTGCQQRQLRWLSDSPRVWDVVEAQPSAFSIGTALTYLPTCLLLSEAWGWCYPRSHQRLPLPAHCHLCPGCCVGLLLHGSLWFSLGPGVLHGILTNLPFKLYHEVICISHMQTQQIQVSTCRIQVTFITWDET